MKKAIITGAGSGLGKGIAFRLAELGYDTAVSYASSRQGAQELRARIRAEYGRECHIFQADFSQKPAMQAFFAEAVQALGALDLFINNAANANLGPEIFDLREEYLDEMYTLNYRSYVIGMREAGLYMARHSIPGCIVNITSVHSRSVWPDDAVYGSFKAGIERITKSFALSLAPHGIRISNIAPGAFRNKTREEAAARGDSLEAYDYREQFARNKIPVPRLGEPAELADLIAFLASESGSYMTGETIVIDGALIIPNMPEVRPQPGMEDRGWGIVKKREF